MGRFKRLLIIGLALSLLVHLAIMWWLSGLWMGGPRGSETVIRIELGPAPLAQTSIDQDPTPEPMGASGGAAVTAPIDMPTPGRLASSLPTTPAAGAGLVNAAGSGPAGTGWGALEIATTIDEPEAGFFGAKAEGRRIAFVVDMSGSMQGERIERTLGELCDSLTSLPDFASVRIVFYSDELYQPFGQNWVDLKEGVAASMCRRMWDEIPSIVAGGTVPGPGFLAVLEDLNRPDAVFFLTDGEVGPGSLMLDRIERANRRRGLESVIHAVILTNDTQAALNQAEPDSLLDRLIAPTGGSITIVPVGGMAP